jgi:hypothetical protein
LMVEVSGITVTMRFAGYSADQAMLFTHYTMTTCGYGKSLASHPVNR